MNFPGIEGIKKWIDYSLVELKMGLGHLNYIYIIFSFLFQNKVNNSHNFLIPNHQSLI